MKRHLFVWHRLTKPDAKRVGSVHVLARLVRAGHNLAGHEGVELLLGQGHRHRRFLRLLRGLTVPELLELQKSLDCSEGIYRGSRLDGIDSETCDDHHLASFYENEIRAKRRGCLPWLCVSRLFLESFFLSAEQ